MYFSTFYSHLNQKTQFENPVDEAKRKKQLGQADTGSSKPGRSFSSIFPSKNNLRDLCTELIKMFELFSIGTLKFNRECLIFANRIL